MSFGPQNVGKAIRTAIVGTAALVALIGTPAFAQDTAQLPQHQVSSQTMENAADAIGGFFKKGASMLGEGLQVTGKAVQAMANGDSKCEGVCGEAKPAEKKVVAAKTTAKEPSKSQQKSHEKGIGEHVQSGTNAVLEGAKSVDKKTKELTDSAAEAATSAMTGVADFFKRRMAAMEADSAEQPVANSQADSSPSAKKLGGKI